MNARLVVLGAIAIALAGSGGTATQGAPGRVIWRGINTDMLMGADCEHQLVQTFEFVGEELVGGETKWLSRKVTWDYKQSCAAEVLMLVDVGAATPQRQLRPWTGGCVNKGEADLNVEPDPARPGQCEESPRLGYIRNDRYPTIGWTGPRPAEQMRDGCAYHSRSRTIGGRGEVGLSTISVTVSRGEIDAEVEVDEKTFRAFVPEPGHGIVLMARSAVPVRFRFELDRDGTSHFPGYATNANIDEAFFTRYNLERLRGQYANDGPDVVFYPSNFAETEWSRIEPTVVESGEPQTSVAVTLTAMDYGAVGRVRAFVQGEECGGVRGWQPVPFRIGGETHETLELPLDADGNLMADALEQYRGIDSGADDDAEPRGNGVGGDGLTAFEEYRGFKIRGSACPGQPESTATLEPGMPPPEPFPDEERSSGIPGWDDEHIRTSPRHKDLFVHALDPELAAMTDDFAWASDVRVHSICEPHYVDNDTRVINFTLQRVNLHEWRGKRVSQDDPQHGIWVEAVDFEPGGLLAAAVSASTDLSLMGPPKFTLGVAIKKPFLIVARGAGEGPAGYRARVTEERATFTRVLTHELSHSVGVPHHGDHVENFRILNGKMNITTRRSVFQRAGGPMPLVSLGDEQRAVEEAGLGGLLVLNVDCDESQRMYRGGQFVGCWADKIARRGQENSGNFECPMRYASADFYEAPGSTAVYRWTGDAGGPGPGHMKVDAWEGKLLKYHNELERRPTGKLCVRTSGTEINALPGDMNHNGDAGREKPCQEFLVVNDVAARGVQ
ncbi:MAG TPA: hypothetical protein VMO26_24325 [Vicinamibacterales bacterium]|nr:hypothetical protein [Vicinamibacterales bacterium]